LDAIQEQYLHKLGLTDTEAYVEHNFAPPSLRRAIGILGFLHKRVLGICHPGLREALPCEIQDGMQWHDKALESNFTSVCSHPRLYNKSLWCYVLIYNRLPQAVIDEKSVAGFQKQLNIVAKWSAECGDRLWRESFQSCMDVVNISH